MLDPENTPEHKVARAVQDAFMATAELYRLQLNPETAALLKREEGELWSIQGRVGSILKEIRSNA